MLDIFIRAERDVLFGATGSPAVPSRGSWAQDTPTSLPPPPPSTSPVARTGRLERRRRGRHVSRRQGQSATITDADASTGPRHGPRLVRRIGGEKHCIRIPVVFRLYLVKIIQILTN
jgi:hypothetical protein